MVHNTLIKHQWDRMERPKDPNIHDWLAILHVKIDFLAEKFQEQKVYPVFLYLENLNSIRKYYHLFDLKLLGAQGTI